MSEFGSDIVSCTPHPRPGHPQLAGSQMRTDRSPFDEDHRYMQGVAVRMRWIIVAAWLVIINYRPDVGLTLYILDGMAPALLGLNAFIAYRYSRGRPVNYRYVLAMSILDLAVITAGIAVTTRFGNTLFVFYYPALLALALLVSSKLQITVIATIAIGTYAALSLGLQPGVDFDAKEEKILLARVASMFAVVVTGQALVGIERSRRHAAIQAAESAERIQSQQAMELQRQEQEIELAAVQERARISREIHDGVAQTVYAVGLELDASITRAERGDPSAIGRLRTLVPRVQDAVKEIRQYIFDLKPLVAGDTPLATVLKRQVREFERASGVNAEFNVFGETDIVNVDPENATACYRVLQEALSNSLKHARATHVDVSLDLRNEQLVLAVVDNGVGFDFDAVQAGYGLENMRSRIEELDGIFTIDSNPDKGTRLTMTLPGKGTND